jgi:hypothetical protein
MDPREFTTRGTYEFMQAVFEMVLKGCFGANCNEFLK